jgi:hypothetical protein
MTNELFWKILWRFTLVSLLLANLITAVRIMNFVREI